MGTQRFQAKQQVHPLNGQGIDAISDYIQECLQTLKYESRNALRMRLSVEEILLIWRDRFGEGVHCTLITGYRFRKPYILLEVEGEACNPLMEEEAWMGEWSMDLLSRLGLSPTYTYAKGKNACRFELKAPALNPVFTMLGAIALAVACGSAGFALPDDFRMMLAAEVLPRLSDTFYGLLGMISGPLVFLSVLMGICGIGDTATLGGIGKKMIVRFGGISLAAAALASGTYAILFGLRLGQGAAETSGLMEMVDMLLGMVPGNILNPFLLNSSLQIIILAALIGVAMLSLGKRAAGLYGIMDQLQQVVQTIMNWIGSQLPILIFIVILQNIWAGSLGALMNVWKPFAFVLCMLALLLAGLVLLTSARLHVKPLALLRKLLPTLMIALTTASSSAALGEIYSCCERKLGVNKKLVNFGVPLGVVMCVTGSCVGFITCVLYSAQTYLVDISLTGLIVATVSTVLLMVAAPPVAGGTVSCYAVIFAQLGIPVEGLGVIVTLNIFLDFFCTAVNVATIEMTLAMQAEKTHQTERSICES